MNAHGKSVDTTYLSVDNAEDRGFIHRDYIAHCLRWTHFVKVMYERKNYQSARILDVGCGRELPLAKLLYSSKLTSAMYYGVDAGPINDDDLEKITRTQKFPHKVWERTNLLELTNGDFDVPEFSKEATPNFVTCFECLEHVEPTMMIDMLRHLKMLTTDDCRFFFSTPCWNRTDCADNHVNEMLYEALGAVFEGCGFEVVNVWGTFASIRDYQHLLGNPSGTIQKQGWVIADIFDQLRSYYDTNFLSCVFAPLFPAQSRNCLWELRKRKETNTVHDLVRRFPGLSEIQQPWGSSVNWKDMEKCLCLISSSKESV